MLFRSQGRRADEEDGLADAIDKAVFLIGATALLNVTIDAISQAIRRRLRVSSGEVFTFD